MKPLIHGGDLNTASAHYSIPESDWIDLSTGINPVAYPCESIPLEAFTRLPYPSQAFKQAILNYYGQHDYISVSGSQDIIQRLPSLLDQLPIMLPSVGYQEHDRAWKQNGNRISYYDALNLSKAQQAISSALNNNPEQHLLIINPNNPSGLLISIERLLGWANVMSGGAKLIIDEAFIDVHPDTSLLTSSKLPDNILVLRSCGKFFGLAGIRAGFLFGSPYTLSALCPPDNPWPLNGVAQEILSKALVDKKWHIDTRVGIQRSADFVAGLFASLNLQLLSNQGLFLSYLSPTPYSEWLYETFAQAGILLRLIPVNSTHSILRIGLLVPNDESAISRVRSCIEHARRQSEPNNQF